MKLTPIQFSTLPSRPAQSRFGSDESLSRRLSKPTALTSQAKLAKPLTLDEILSRESHDLNTVLPKLLPDLIPTQRVAMTAVVNQLIEGKTLAAKFDPKTLKPGQTPPNLMAPVLLMGGPGSGKTHMVLALAKALNRPVFNMSCRDARAGYDDAHYRGYPSNIGFVDTGMSIAHRLTKANEAAQDYGQPRPLIIVDEPEKQSAEAQNILADMIVSGKLQARDGQVADLKGADILLTTCFWDEAMSDDYMTHHFTPKLAKALQNANVFLKGESLRPQHRAAGDDRTWQQTLAEMKKQP